MEKEYLDLLKKVEQLTAKLNQIFSEKGKSVFSRYPLTFALLVVFGVSMVMEGIKGLLKEIEFLKNAPLMMLLSGMIILIFTGTLYKKLDK